MTARGPRATVAITLVAAAACSLSLVDVQEESRVSVELDVLSGADSTFDQVLNEVQHIFLEFARDGVSVDTILPFRVAEGAGTVRLALVPPEGEGALQVRAELRAPLGTVFTGETVIARGATEATGRVAIRPVVYRVGGTTEPSRLDALEDTAAVDSWAGFVTGDPIPDIRPKLTSLRPDLVEVLNDSMVVSHGNGVAPLTVTYGSLNFGFPLVVAQLPASLSGILPEDTTVLVGDTVRYRLLGLDPNGRPILPGADVTWLASGAVSVDSLGRAVAVGDGTGEVMAYPLTGGPVSASVTILP